MNYIALRTIAEDGTSITDQPTSSRVIETGTHYGAILDVCRAHRVNTYQHPDGEVRTLSETERAGCARTNPELFAWIQAARVVKRGGYAIPVSENMLHTYEPGA